MTGEDTRRSAALAGTGVLAVAVTCWAMYQEIADFRHRGVILAGMDFWNNTWWAVRGLLAGVNVYGPTRAVIPGVEPVWPVSPHVPASLLWQAPFAALPIPLALYAYTLASALAIWAGVFVLARRAAPWAVAGYAACGAFVILFGAGPRTLLLGQPTGFILLGLALVIRARRPWVAAFGLMLAASTLQMGLPLALTLIVLRMWPIVWRGAVLIVTWSVPPVALGIAKAGLHAIVGSVTASGGDLLGRTSHRIDLGELLLRAGVQSTVVQVGVGVLALAAALLFMARLPARLRRIDYPPVLCLAIVVILLCTYHESYDMLLVGGVVAGTALATGAASMLPVFVMAGIGAGLAGNSPLAAIVDPICLTLIALISALVAGRAPALTEEDSLGSIGVAPKAETEARPPVADLGAGPGRTTVRSLANGSR